MNKNSLLKPFKNSVTIHIYETTKLYFVEVSNAKIGFPISNENILYINRD
jgi:hypothetical protein